MDYNILCLSKLLPRQLAAAVAMWLALPLGVMAQRQVVEALVVDAETRTPLPFASVYVSPGVGTITNAEGCFRVAAGEGDHLRISFVGYQTLTVRAEGAGSVIALQPIGQQLGEVVVRPLPLKDIVSTTLRQMRKFLRKRANFFYRQTAFVDSVCYEMAEAFLTGCSAVSLRDLRLTHGRYAGIQSDSLQAFSFYKNFYTFSQIPLAGQKEIPPPDQDVMPLFPGTARYYDVDYDILHDTTATVYAIRLCPKPDIIRTILDCTLYVDAATLHVLRCQGSGRNFLVLQTYPEAMNRPNEVLPVEFDFDIRMTEQNGFTEVQSVYVESRHTLPAVSDSIGQPAGLSGQTLCTRSLLFNTGPRRNKGGGGGLDFYGNLHQSIEGEKYDARFWSNNETVLRTPTEEAVARLFEREDLFGVY